MKYRLEIDALNGINEKLERQNELLERLLEAKENVGKHEASPSGNPRGPKRKSSEHRGRTSGLG